MAVKKVKVDRNLPVSSNLRLYSVLKDVDRVEFLNIFRSHVISNNIREDETIFSYYTIEEEDWLDNIAAIHYNSPYLWWVVALFNDITNPFEELVEGDTLKILKYEFIYIIFDDISEIEAL